MKASLSLLALVASVSAHAQAPGFDAAATPWGPGRRSSGEAFRSTAEPLPDAPLHWAWEGYSLALGGQYQVRGEGRDNADLKASAQDFTAGVEQRARLSLRATAKARVGVLLEFQDVRLWGSETTPSTLMPNTGLHQAYVDLRALEGLELRVGKQEIAYGEERLVGALDWSLTARAFDGVFVRFTPSPHLTVDGFSALLKPPAYVTADGTGARVHNSGNYFSGFYARARHGRAGLDAYVLDLLEDPTSAAAGAQRDNHRVTLGARAFAHVSNLAVVGEGAYQLGNVGPTSEPVRAGAGAVKATWTFAGAWASPYVMGEFSAASGDGNMSDGVEGTFHQLFPTGHGHLGFMDYVGWQNVVAGRGTLGFRPGGNHVWLDVHRFSAWDPRAAWYAANGSVFLAADPARTRGDMGTEVDLSATFPVADNVALAGNLSAFFPGKEAAASKGRGASTWGFLYVRSQF